jgi:hypothetical protein
VQVTTNEIVSAWLAASVAKLPELVNHSTFMACAGILICDLDQARTDQPFWGPGPIAMMLELEARIG